jgi:hypothetical protein
MGITQLFRGLDKLHYFYKYIALSQLICFSFMDIFYGSVLSVAVYGNQCGKPREDISNVSEDNLV